MSTSMFAWYEATHDSLEVMAESIRAQSQPSSYDLFYSQEETYQLPEGVDAASRLQPAKFTVSGNEGQLEIANIRVFLQRSTSEAYLQRGKIGYGEGPRNMGTSLYSKECIRSLIEDALGIAARKNSNAIYEQIYKWLIDCKATGQDVFVFD